MVHFREKYTHFTYIYSLSKISFWKLCKNSSGPQGNESYWKIPFIWYFSLSKNIFLILMKYFYLISSAKQKLYVSEIVVVKELL